MHIFKDLTMCKRMLSAFPTRWQMIYESTRFPNGKVCPYEDMALRAERMLRDRTGKLGFAKSQARQTLSFFYIVSYGVYSFNGQNLLIFARLCAVP